MELGAYICAIYAHGNDDDGMAENVARLIRYGVMLPSHGMWMQINIAMHRMSIPTCPFA